MGLLRQKAPQIREKRLQAVNAFYNSAKELLAEFDENNVNQRVRTFSQDIFNDIIYALKIINRIHNSVVVIHGPRGCAASQVYFESQNGYDRKWAVTNINEKDSILGSEAKLKEAAISLHRRYKPEIIFIVTTPVVAINNDDVQAVVEELKDELGVEVVPVYSDGFKSKISTIGYDQVHHALGKYLFKGVQSIQGDFINILSVGENNEDLEEIKRLIKELGIKANILPQNANLQNFIDAAKARVTVSVNPDDSEYLGRVIEEKFGIEFLRPSLPIGINGTSQWISALAKQLGIEKEAKLLEEREVSGLKDLLKENDLEGLTVYLSLPPSYAFGIKEFLEELGASVAGITVPFIQSTHVQNLETILRKDEKFNLHVAEGQTFEEVNILERLQPSLYIGWAGQVNSASRLGIPSVLLSEEGVLGYKGAYRLVRKISKALKNQSFLQRLSVDTKETYQTLWYSKRPNWYIKQEVK
ncbi:MAG: nitrogenase component 1 [Clostridia bacterium]|nr:nitrogenase component 1 [Clostridia bacterium]